MHGDGAHKLGLLSIPVLCGLVEVIPRYIVLLVPERLQYDYVLCSRCCRELVCECRDNRWTRWSLNEADEGGVLGRGDSLECCRLFVGEMLRGMR